MPPCATTRQSTGYHRVNWENDQNVIFVTLKGGL
jgi:hypothetical protein